jgi:two-component system response regulator AtoC
MEISAQALGMLERQPWPGNVRQLQNFVERLVVMSDGDRLTVSDVEREIARHPHSFVVAAPARPDATEPARSEAVASAEGTTLDASRREAERRAILTALERAGNNRSLAARLLLISRRSLYNKLAEHGLA